ncbi:MAG: hypothetical protein LBQ88_09495 [Treponema sp.]|jgi:hypothetical protein|nr:hypothetical protein [Treponema sp.]
MNIENERKRLIDELEKLNDFDLMNVKSFIMGLLAHKNIPLNTENKRHPLLSKQDIEKE